MFFVLAVGLDVVVVIALMVFFTRRRWLGGPRV
jgi:hypothetical protein